MPTALHWFRRDLRLTGNPALAAAARESGGSVIPLYIRSRWHGAHRWTGAARQTALCECLRALAAGLEEAGSRLILREGEAALEAALRETGAKLLSYQRSPDPFGRAEEARVEALAQQLGVRVLAMDDVTTLPPDALRTSTGQPYRVFTPYARAWLRQEPEASGGAHPPLQPVPPAMHSIPLPTPESWGLTRVAEPGFAHGEPAARRRMRAFFGGPIYHYAAGRDLPAADATSRFSADLRWGTLSPRELAARSRRAIAQAPDATARHSAQIFLNELIWREFFMSILWHWPEVLEHEFAPAWRGLPWRTSPALFQRWAEGQTGFPLVDAGMRQLSATGTLPNRVRMVVAMFLTKDLRIDWRLGEAHFLRHLTDGEIASNNGGWQWSAGTGADAAPYFRIQNPWAQSARHDPQGEYIRRWLPELRDTPAARLHKAATSPLARGYPLPMVDHAEERAATLSFFQEARQRR